MPLRGLTTLVVLLAVSGGAPSLAQNSMAPSVEPDKWQELSPENRNQLRREYLESLPPNKRRKLRSQVERFNAMSTAEKQDLCRRFQKDRGYLPPACQKLF